MSTLAELDAATAVALDSSSVASTEAASRLKSCQAYLEAILAAPDSWDFCLKALSVTSATSTKFFCLQVGRGRAGSFAAVVGTFATCVRSDDRSPCLLIPKHPYGLHLSLIATSVVPCLCPRALYWESFGSLSISPLWIGSTTLALVPAVLTPCHHTPMCFSLSFRWVSACQIAR